MWQLFSTAMVALCLLTSSDTARKLEVRFSCDAILYSDMIVEGNIIDVTRKSAPVVRARPSAPKSLHSYSIRITVITVEIDGVFKGDYADGTVDFIAYTSASNFRDNYNIGDRILVGLWWDSEVFDGSYVLWSDRARLRKRSDGRWDRQDERKTTPFSYEEIKELILESDPMVLAKSSELVLVGIVASSDFVALDWYEESEIKGHLATLDIKEVLRGPKVENITFFAPKVGRDWPIWRYPAPWVITPGKTYCVFLKKHDGNYILHGGINGVYLLEGENLLFRESTAMTFTLSSIRNALRNSKKD